MKKLLLLLLAVAAAFLLSRAQSVSPVGTLKGVVKDEIGQALPFVKISVLQYGTPVAGAICNIDGEYTIANIAPGMYDIKFESLGYDMNIARAVDIKPGMVTPLDIIMKKTVGAGLACVTVTAAKTSQISKDQTVQSTTWDRKSLQKIPNRDATGAAQLTGGANSRSGETQLRGSRGDASIFIDGVKVRGGSGLPQSAVQQVQTNLPGTPSDLGGVPPINSTQISSMPAPTSSPSLSTSSYTPYVPDASEYKDFEDNPFLSSLTDPLSTFSVDVDKASYTVVRKHITSGIVPPAGAVRLEEMVNYFDYDYPDPDDVHPFRIITELTECPWNKESRILKLALQGKRIEEAKLPPSVFTFLVDVSGSMESPNKLPLVQASLLKLLEKMRPEDKVGIVVYAGAAGVVLDPQAVGKKSVVVSKIMEMRAGGSTAGGQGIQLAYKLAEEHFVKDGNNRIILCTDGDFNVGISSDSDLATLIEKEREKGIFLTVLGFGMGNYKDSKLETLADKGNGNYAYIDDYAEAEKFLGHEFAGSMYTIAKDVKIQIEFNPEFIKSYRLIGYENRVLAAQDFNDDKKDAGEIGAGHTVTALYEIRTDEKYCGKVDPLKYQQQAAPAQQSPAGEIATVKFRYKKPDGDKSILIEKPLGNDTKPFKDAEENTRFAISVAAFGQLMRKSPYVKDLALSDVLEMAAAAEGTDKDGLRREFVQLVKSYRRLTS